MFKRARIALVVALVAAFLGFTGLLHDSQGIVQFMFYIIAGFSCLSLLFSLFEESEARSNSGRVARVKLTDEPAKSGGG